MLVEEQEAIIVALQELGLFKCLDSWQGEIEELIKVPRNLPSAHVALGEIDFGEEATAIGTKLSLDENIWNVIITASSRRDQKSGAVECYQLLETVVAKLKMLPIGSGWLWPVKARLLYNKNGLSLYGVAFIIEQEQ